MDITIDLNEFKRNGINNEDIAFITAMGNVGIEEENVLRYLALGKLGLVYDGDDYTLMLDGASIWRGAKHFFTKNPNFLKTA